MRYRYDHLKIKINKQMKNLCSILYSALSIFLLTTFFSCQQPGKNVTGSEYMPDMAHSIAYEANTYVYYINNRWGSEDDLYKMVQPRRPVEGTIARGIAGGNLGFAASESHQGIAIQANGSMPYYYTDTEEERTKAMNEILKNPYPISDSGISRGKELYMIYCATCHGDKGDGAGYLVRDDGGKYPVQPANFMLDEFIAASNGRFYHSIIYGKNMMAGYADKLAYEERWQVIHYIRSLQAGFKKLEYSGKVNTFNTIDIPQAKMKAEAISKLSGDGEESLN